jgi:hypothetical protein
MTNTVDALLARIHALEAELEQELASKRREFEFIIEKHRVRFPLAELTRQRLHKVGLLRYVLQGRWQVLLSAPLVYACVLPLLALDLFITIYQQVCFRVYGIPTVRRADYLVFDRADLPYLNALERLNCAYCSYGNGVAAYVREVAARTEQYWCPIKHARRQLAAHERYVRFFEFGDARAYREGLERLRQQLGEAELPP